MSSNFDLAGEPVRKRGEVAYDNAAFQSDNTGPAHTKVWLKY